MFDDNIKVLFIEQWLAPDQLSPFPKRSAAIKDLMQELERQRQDEVDRHRTRGRPRLPFLADEERFALAYIAAYEEFWGPSRHYGATMAAGYFCPGRGQRTQTRVTGMLQVSRLLIVGRDHAREKQEERARTLGKKLRNLPDLAREWCSLSAYYLALLSMGFPWHRTYTLLAGCRLAQLGWDGKVPEELRRQQDMVRDFTSVYSKRNR